MTVWQLRVMMENKGTAGYFWSRDTLRFFGERESEMRVLKKMAMVKDYKGNDHECYVLSTLQRNHPMGPTRHYYYIDKNTFERILA